MSQPGDVEVAEDEVRELREQHIGRLLLQAQRAFNARAIAKLHARGHAGLTVAHTALLPHLDLEGTRITTLAERAGMTKQGMGQLVSELERQGYVRRGTDPTDARAVLVRFTDAGWQFLRDAHAVKRELETEYATILGQEQLDALRRTLQAIVQDDLGAA